MERKYLGELEEITLLTVAVLHGKAYGVAIIREIEDRMNRKVSLGALQTVLRRMEKKGYLESHFGEATKVRGGKRKRYFVVTNFGKKALEQTKEVRLGLWESIPKIAFDSWK